MEKLKILNLNFSFQRAAHYHINGGMLLMGVVLLAMFLANSPWGDIYASFWNYKVHLQIGEFNFFSHNGHHMTLMTFINDALMAVSFFSVGLEISVRYWWANCPVSGRRFCPSWRRAAVCWFQC